MSNALGVLPSTVFSLIARLADSDGLIRQRAREELVDIGQPAVPALISALDSPEGHVRWEVVKALQDIADPAVAPALVRALEDREFGVRWLAAEGLVNMGRRSLASLLKALTERGDSVWLREGAHHVLKAMSRRGLPEPVEPVLAALEDVEPELVVPPVARDALKLIQPPAGE